jgi:hypothetical protein
VSTIVIRPDRDNGQSLRDLIVEVTDFADGEAVSVGDRGVVVRWDLAHRYLNHKLGAPGRASTESPAEAESAGVGAASPDASGGKTGDAAATTGDGDAAADATGDTGDTAPRKATARKATNRSATKSTAKTAAPAKRTSTRSNTAGESR